MFEAGAWDDGDLAQQPQLSALSWAMAQSQPSKPAQGEEDTVTVKSGKKKKSKKSKQSIESDSNDVKNSSEKQKRTKPPKISTITKRMALSVENGLDKLINSPSATKKLLDDDEDEDSGDENDGIKKKKDQKRKNKLAGKLKSTAVLMSDAGKKIGRSLSDSSLREPGYLIKMGEKFSSQEAFLRFMGLPGKSKKGKKRQRIETEVDNANDSQESIKDDDEKENSGNGESNGDVPVPPPRKKRKGEGLDVDKIRDLLSKDNQSSVPVTSTSPTAAIKSIHKTLADQAREKLTASRFRYLNEQLYTQPSNAAVKLFNSDSTLFTAYHQGYQHQAKQWPLDPLNVVITDILRLDSAAVVADLGCGEARLARSVPNTVHSFDLVAANERVTVADIAHTPLEAASVDVVVFCLSLMGTNIRDFVFEAARILKVGGTLKIAELESRFQGEDLSVESFIQNVEKFGFKNSWKDLKKDFFYFIDFTKTSEVKKKKKLPDLALKACLYKKR